MVVLFDELQRRPPMSPEASALAKRWEAAADPADIQDWDHAHRHMLKQGIAELKAMKEVLCVGDGSHYAVCMFDDLIEELGDLHDKRTDIIGDREYLEDVA